MAAIYPLAGILFIRDFRVDAAAKAVGAAEALLRDEQAKCARRREEHAAYRIWRIEETARRYRQIIGQCLGLGDVDKFKKGLALLADEELQKEAAVQEAAQAVEAARQNVAAARQSWRNADLDRQKILYHREQWQKDRAVEAARAVDLEMEEFKPLLFVAEAGAEE
jgi:type III secretion protein O